MLLSRCTALVLGAALSFGLPAALAGEAAVPEPSGRVSAPPTLGEFGVATYQLIREDPTGGRLWWLYDGDSKVLGTLEYRPPDPAPGTAGDTYVLTFKGDALVARMASTRVVFQLNDAAPVAFSYDESSHRVVADPANAKEGFEAIRSHLKLLSALIDGLLRKSFNARVEPLDDEAPCTGDWHNRVSWGVFPTRSWACSDATIRVNNACAEASTYACAFCCELNPDCDCACIPETEFGCFCNRSGKACAPGCPPANPPPSACKPENCSVDCYQVAISNVPAGRRVIGGTCNFATDCQCDAWVNTCNPSDNGRDTVYSGVRSCPDPCPPACNAPNSTDSPNSCGNVCGGGMCFDPNPTCCFDSYCGPPNADCCTDGGSCPDGWNCCDDGTSSCCPGGYQCCWLEDGPMCCDFGGDTRPDQSSEPLRTAPRLQKNQPPLTPKSPKE
jgi:hypothetical protein